MATLRICTAAGKLFKYLPKTDFRVTAIRHGGYQHGRVPVLRELLKRKNEMGPDKPQHRNTFLEWNYKAEVYAFANRIGEKFEGDVLQKALTQRSHVLFELDRQKELGIEHPKGYLEDNQELAEKGEMLMKDIVGRYLRTSLPYYPEEGILAIRDYLMREENLAYIISNIGAEELVLCTDFPVEKKTLASTMCSLVGAVEESSGRDRAALFVRDFVIATLSGQEINAIWQPENPMEALKNILSREGREEPEPRLIGQSGVKTIIPCYRVGLYCSKQLIGMGNGEEVDIAIEQAALDALWRLWGTVDGKVQFPFRLDISTCLKNSQDNIPLPKWSSKEANQRVVSLKQ